MRLQASGPKSVSMTTFACCAAGPTLLVHYQLILACTRDPMSHVSSLPPAQMPATRMPFSLSIAEIQTCMFGCVGQ